MEEFNIGEELKKLPDKPGVYLMHDAKDNVIYVGKAVNLKNRVRSYFRAGVPHTAIINKMISLIDRFEYIITDSELEALVLENNLIKEHSPKYNTLLKDDKTYPSIKVTVDEDFPRILMTRTIRKDKCRYFGPFTSAGAVKDTIDIISKMYRIRTCNGRNPGSGDRECLNYHIGKCSAPCTGKISKEDYRANVDKALEILNGDFNPVIKKLEQEMTEAAEKLEFEEAAKIRELIESVKSIKNRQKINDSELMDRDYIAMARNERDVIMQVFFVREGRLIGREHFYMKNAVTDTESEVYSSFLKQYYGGTPFLPGEIFVPVAPNEQELIEKWLTERRTGSVKIRIPQKGNKEKLLELAAKNAELVLSVDTEKIKKKAARTKGAVEEIEQLIGVSGIVRMEAFDISNTSGFANVGSMVVYENGIPKKSDYRKFKMKTVTGPDDYACMREVLTRRLSHDDSFGRHPDLLLMDGGRGQVNIALEVLDELGLDIPVCGMVKDDNHRTRGLYFNNVEIPIDTHSEGFKLITRIQDEAHRFAIEYHRPLRTKAQAHSVLDEIPGVGPARRRALMKHFSSIEDLKNSDVETLSAIPEITVPLAEEILEFLNKSNVPGAGGDG
ncbi:MAG: excinuclease ABC subunit UvrC [Lachnospiraceae bacterium]|nr:excinuclease ABC subunit UvrC [Lachnospiraceae bacterium]